MFMVFIGLLIYEGTGSSYFALLFCSSFFIRLMLGCWAN